MYKFAIFAIALLSSGFAQAQNLNYGDYSKEYTTCLEKISWDSEDADRQMENCRLKECEELAKEIDKLLPAVLAMPKFKEYNSMHNITLSESVQMRKKYGEAFCEMDTNIRGHSRALSQCRLTMLNNLYIDLHNLYNAAKK